MNARRFGPIVAEAPAELAPLQPVESAPPGNRGPASGDQAGAPGNDTRPPTPLLPPSLAPDAANPFGKAPGTARPGVIAPGGPPPGVVYPPVTNPNPTQGTVPAEPGP